MKLTVGQLKQLILESVSKSFSLNDGFSLVDASNPRFPETHQWNFVDADGNNVGYISVYVTGYTTGPAIADVRVDDSVRGRGLGSQAVLALRDHYGSLSSDPQGNTTPEAIRMWQRLGARKTTTTKNSKGYFYILD